MKVEIELSDVLDVIRQDCEAGYLPTENDIKKYIVDNAIEKFVESIYEHYAYGSGGAYNVIYQQIRDVVKRNESEIINSVIDGVESKVLRKKAIANKIPKKSDLEQIDKEWEDYFIGLIDRAIAKKFNNK